MKLIIVVLLIVLTLLLTACGAQDVYLCSDGSIGGGQKITANNINYFCPNGQPTNNYNSCDFPTRIVIQQSDAESKALSFVNGHLRANGYQSTLVNVNKVENNWLAQIVVSKFDEQSFETVIKIDGTTGFATCNTNCDYLSK